MTLAAAYIRVSTEEQAAYSPAAQLAEIRAFAQKNGYRIPEEWVFTDEGISGRNAANRPAFQRMIRLARQKNSPMRVLLVHKYDRFARSREDAVLYKALLKQCGVRVVSVKEPVPQDDKAAVLYESMLEAMAEYYSLNLAEEVNKTMRKKAACGQWQTAAPFGYRNEGKSLSAVPEEAEFVRYLFAQYAAGVSAPALARRLNRMGARTRRGKPFEGRSVRYILRNPVYCGFLRWTPGKRADRDYLSPAAITAKGDWEAIVPTALWERAALRLQAEQEHRKPRPAADAHWLSGMVKCAACGHSLAFGAAFRNGARQLQCSGYSHGRCAVSHAVSTNRLLPALFSALEEAVGTAVPFSLRQEVPTQAKAEEAAIVRLLEKARLRLHRAKEAYLDGIDTLAEYRENKSHAEAEATQWERCLEALRQNAHPAEGAPRPSRLSLPELLRADTFSMEEKQAALRAVMEPAVFEKETQRLRVYFIGDE